MCDSVLQPAVVINFNLITLATVGCSSLSHKLINVHVGISIEGDLSAQDTLIVLATAPEKRAMFPAFSSAIYKLLLLPIGTATVERSFSTMNRILNSKRCRLLPEHTCQLMQLAVEGPCVPDVRDAKEDDLTVFNEFLEKAYRMWLAKPRRGLQ